jgi:hypothetical protein
MPKMTEIICDGCGNDLTITSNCLDFRLALVNESVPSEGGLVTDMAAYPAIEQNTCFCGVDCLRTWLDKRYPPRKAPYHGGKCWAEYQRQQRAVGKPRHWK